MLVVPLRYVKPLEEIDRLAPEHFRFLQRYFDSGIFILAGQTGPARRWGHNRRGYHCARARCNRPGGSVLPGGRCDVQDPGIPTREVRYPA